MRSPQFGKYHKGKRGSQTALPAAVQAAVAVINGGRLANPQRDKPKSREDNRTYVAPCMQRTGFPHVVVNRLRLR